MPFLAPSLPQGDTVIREEGSWRIMGRTSVDILKCGGYKLSALEIEGHLLEHDGVGECAVVGVPDEAYGQVVAAVLVGKGGKPPPTLPELRQWARSVMAPYKVRDGLLAVVNAVHSFSWRDDVRVVLTSEAAGGHIPQVPTQLRVLEALPRNAMGKVNKKELLKLFTEGEKPAAEGEAQASKKPRIDDEAPAEADKK